jgi:hypothetical protein
MRTSSNQERFGSEVRHYAIRRLNNRGNIKWLDAGGISKRSLNKAHQTKLNWEIWGVKNKSTD